MQVDLYRDLGSLLIIEEGREISQISCAGSVFLDGLTYERTISVQDLPTGLAQTEVLQSLKQKGFYAARQHLTLTEVEIQD